MPEFNEEEAYRHADMKEEFIMTPRYFPDRIRIRATIMVLVMAGVLICGCQNGGFMLARTAQEEDTTPPVFTNLVFPANGSSVPAGQLVISGTLADAGGLDLREPIALEVIPSLLESPNTFRLVRNSRDVGNPNWFDPLTGEFYFDFVGSRLKPYPMLLQLTGKDAAGNTCSVSANITVGEVPGIDTQLLPQARQYYAQTRLSAFSGLKTCLEVYGAQYSYDIAVLNDAITYLNVCASGPSADGWLDAADALAANVQSRQYSDPVFKAGVDYAVETYRADCHDYSNESDFPSYGYGISVSDIQEGNNELVQSLRNPTINMVPMPVSIPVGTVSCRITINGWWGFHPKPPDPLADILVVANPNAPLVITGTIGPPLRQIAITPSDYDPPIKLFKLFYDQALVFPTLINF
jgi:hypothetical protein